MPADRVRYAAELQSRFGVEHSSGYPVSNHITVMLKMDTKVGDVKPEVYMISDQGQAIEKYSLFLPSDDQKMMKVRKAESPKEALPSFVSGGKPAEAFEVEYLLVKIAHGSPNSKKFAILKKEEFPAYVRDRPSKKDFIDFIKKHRGKPTNYKYGDFQFLLYLTDILDLETVATIADHVQREEPVSEIIEDLIDSKTDL